jgi:hypothetical protein
LAFCIEQQPVIAATQPALDTLTHGKRRETMRATILQRRNAAIMGLKEHQAFAHDSAREWLVFDVAAPGAGVPAIAHEPLLVIGGFSHR